MLPNTHFHVPNVKDWETVIEHPDAIMLSIYATPME